MLLKNRLLLLLLSLFFLSPVSGFAAVKAVTPVQKKEEIREAVKEAKKEWKSLSRKERKAKRKEMRKEIKKAIREHRANDETDTLLLVIITILLPPLGMYLYEDEINSRFWISLLLTLLFYLPGLIYTLIIILGEK
jgi:uncharacterized membrane protein YqaE (UPF0057 family)